MFIAVCATAPKVLWLNAFSPTVADQVNGCMTIDGTIAHVHQRSAAQRRSLQQGGSGQVYSAALWRLT